MTFLLNVGFSDNVTFVHRLDFGGTPDRSRGLKAITVSPSVDYILNENLTLRAFIDYNATRPYISTNPPVTNIEGGITMRMTLN
jgi:cell surface protein SprA